ncbi:MAG: sulfatase-like hydrolase/transferase [Myxococcota bacterium]|nr:sulfatase-like hydrolase/transferase [Myxococcota bacterium]
MLGLSAFAFGQPLLDLLRQHPTFFVAHRIEGWELLLVVAVLLLGPPVALWLALRAIALANPRAGHLATLFTIGALVAITALPLLKRGPIESAAILGLLSCAAGALVATALGRTAVRTFLALLGLAPAVFAATFLTDGGIRSLVVSGGSPPLLGPAPRAAPPIVIVILDELPTVSLLDAAGRIDEVRYPAFGRRARASTWLRKASAVHYKTAQALPAILTGRHPADGSLPTASAHPNNLFSLLAGHYDLNVVETMSRLMGDLESLAVDEERESGRSLLLLADLRLLWLHVVLPESLTRSLPPIDQTWKGFAPDDDGGALFREGQLAPDRRRELFGDRPGRFRRFIASIGARERPTLHFLHVLLPHRPWRYLPSGLAYAPTPEIGLKRGPWAHAEWWAVDGQQKHLLQLEFTDVLLGELLDRLEKTGLYDECLLVVLSDHGVGFWPGDHRRFPGMAHPVDTLAVPFLVKRPGQRLGEIDDRNVETIDLVPTLADVLDIEVPWPVDGCSVFAPTCAGRTQKTMHTHHGTTFHFEPTLPLRGESLERKLRLFGSGSATTRVSHWGPHAGLVGRRLESLAQGDEPLGSIELPRESFRLPRNDPAHYATARITGSLLDVPDDLPDDLSLAIVVDGTVRAVTVAHRVPEEPDRHRFSGFVEERALGHAGAKLGIFTIEGDGEALLLRTAPITLR